MRSLQEQFSNNASSTVEPNTTATATKPMDNSIVKAELIVNITLGENNILSESTINTIQSRKGVLMNTRAAGAIRFNSNDGSVYADFNPLPNTTHDKNGIYNGAVWRLTTGSGEVKVLSHTESLRYWSLILGGMNISTTDSNGFFVKVNFPAKYDRATVDGFIRQTAVRSYVITFTDLDSMFNFAQDEYRQAIRLAPVGATVDFSSSIVSLERPTIGSGKINLSSIVDGPNAAVSNFDIKSFLKAPVKTSVATSSINFDGVDVADVAAPVQVAAAKASVEAIVVDAPVAAPIAVAPVEEEVIPAIPAIVETVVETVEDNCAVEEAAETQEVSEVEETVVAKATPSAGAWRARRSQVSKLSADEIAAAIEKDSLFD